MENSSTIPISLRTVSRKKIDINTKMNIWWNHNIRRLPKIEDSDKLQKQKNRKR